MYKYVEEIIFKYILLLLLTLHVPLRVDKCTLGVHVPQVGNPCDRTTSVVGRVNTKVKKERKAFSFHMS